MISVENGVELAMQFPRSINSERFCKFLVALRNKHPFKKLALFLDNLSCHHSKSVKRKYQELQIRPIFNAAYYPRGNPIEEVFSIVKREFKAQKLDRILNGKEVV